MENKSTKYLSIKRTCLLFVLYFAGYLFLFPRITSKITLAINPDAQHIAIPLVMASYAITLLLAYVLLIPVLKGQWNKFLQHFKENIKQIFYYFFVIIILNISASFFIALITQSTGSNNQETIAASSRMAPLLTAVSAIFIAPFLEEFVFRAGIFSCLRKYMPFWLVLLISSMLFGSIHIVESFMQGDLLDVSYVFVYAIIGCVLGYSFEKSNCIYVPITIHMLNNIMAFGLLLL